MKRRMLIDLIARLARKSLKISGLREPNLRQFWVSGYRCGHKFFPSKIIFVEQIVILRVRFPLAHQITIRRRCGGARRVKTPDACWPKAATPGRTLAKLEWLLSLANPAIGARPIAEISASEILSALTLWRRADAVKPLGGFAQQSARFPYAIATGRAHRDPSPLLRARFRHEAVRGKVSSSRCRAVKKPEREATQSSSRLSPNS